MPRNSERAFEIAATRIAPGSRGRCQIEVARLPAGGWLSLPIEILHGSEPGPSVFLSGAIHGDELDGVEITRRVLDALSPSRIRGTLVAAPIVNLPGVVAETRYLPDRRDLNRSFPGSASGSLGSRLAHLFMREVVQRCSHGIDFHCGSDDRENLPQVRANLDDEDTRRLAMAFGAPVAIHAPAPAGSLRRAAVAGGARVLLYEAGEARRFTAAAITTGVRGTMRVLAELDMIDPPADEAPPVSAESRRRRWVRASRSGLFLCSVALGDRVRRGDSLGMIRNVGGTEEVAVRARTAGLVIGRRINPITYQGEALVHIAEIASGATG